ncbi:MAG: hypothetical protein R3E08_14280 [Thiotrichaceae bacterium]
MGFVEMESRLSCQAVVTTEDLVVEIPSLYDKLGFRKILYNQ